MVRTLISLPEKDKHWLEGYSQLHHISLAQAVRAAVELYIKQKKDATRREILLKSRGIWPRKEDALEYVRKLREEWDER
ncbi:MAG: CopG family transcriptional regulator [Candidatus Omnitrophica bacterium]|nr:CopG family transcriptional regulator [Candidatus Omnitrophota bacterium]